MADVGPLNPKERAEYEQQYAASAALFQKALAQYSQASNPYSQAKFQDVMNQSMQIMQETARNLMRRELDKSNEQIEKDYATFQQHPTDPDTINKLNHDLDQAKNLSK